MGIAVADCRRPNQRPGPLHVFDDGFIGFENHHPVPIGHLVGEPALVVHRAQHRQAIPLARDIVLLPVPRGGVDAAGSLFQGDIVGQDQHGVAVDEWVAADLAFEYRALDPGQHRALAQAAVPQEAGEQAFGHQQNLAIDFDGRIVVVRVQGDGQIRRQCPRSRGPDHHAERLTDHFRDRPAKVRLGRKFNVDRRAFMVAVFHLGLGQGRLAGDAPEHRFGATVDVTHTHEVAKDAGDGRLIRVAHRQVRVGPIAEYPQPLELLPLDAHVFFGVAAAVLPELQDVHLLAAEPQLRLHPFLDGKAMTIPPGNVGAEETLHGLVLDDKILKNFVQRSAQVDVPVGVRGAVMQNVSGPPFVLPQDFLIQADGLPETEHLRLVLHQVGLHLEICPRQIDGILYTERLVHGETLLTVLVKRGIIST